MNKNLEHIIKIYSTKEHKEFNNNLLDMSKDDLIALFSDLLTMYINDKNSSTIRELLTVILAGYTHNTKKIGFNGFKQSSSNKPINCEAKPKNYHTQDFLDYKEGKRKNPPAKLNGNGNFTDYTWARLAKDKISNLNMLISGFIDGQLIYLFEFPFLEKTFLAKLENLLKKRFPHGDKTGEYLRSASFSFQDYAKSRQIKVIYVIIHQKLKEYQPYLNKNLFQFLSKTK
jgi:hypothetical protein